MALQMLQESAVSVVVRVVRVVGSGGRGDDESSGRKRVGNLGIIPH